MKEVRVDSIMPTRRISAVITGGKNDWGTLCDKVEDICKALNVENKERIARGEKPEELLLDFKEMNIVYTADTAVYANTLAAMPGVHIKLYNQPDLAQMMQIAADLSEKPASYIENETVLYKSLVVKPKSKTELAEEKKELAFKEKFNELLEKYISCMSGGKLSLNMEEIVSSVGGRYSFSDTNRICVLGPSILQEHIDNGLHLTSIVLDFRKYVGIVALKNDAIDAYKVFRKQGIGIEVMTDNEKETELLSVRILFEHEHMTAEEKIAALKKLGFGRVGVLSIFKEHNTDNMDLRMKEEVCNQYVAVLDGIAKANRVTDDDGVIPTYKVYFKTFILMDMNSRADVYAKTGEWFELNTKTLDEVTKEFAEENEGVLSEEDYAEELEEVRNEWLSNNEMLSQYGLNFSRRGIYIEDLGIEHLCLGKLAHFNLFDGTVGTEHSWTTSTDKYGEYSSEVLKAVDPDYIRRIFLSYGFDKQKDKKGRPMYNDAKLIEDIHKFEDECGEHYFDN